MYINKKQIDSLNAILDYLASSTDGVDDPDYWEDLHSDLYDVIQSAKKEHNRLHNNRIVKKAIKSAKRRTKKI